MGDNLPERQPEGNRYPSHADLDLIARFGKMFSMSGMFDDIKGEIQAAVKILAGREVGLQPFAAMQSIDIISGKPVFNSGFLAACVKNHPRYSYRVVEISDDRCELAFLENGENIGVSIFTTEDAQKAGLLGGRSGMYQKYPRNMLFARALSNGVAWHTPDVLSARGYVEGEIPAPDVRPEQEGGRTATVPEREPENVIDVEPEMGTAVQEPEFAETAERAEAIREEAAEAAKAPEQVAHEAQQASDMADDMHSARESEVSQREATAESMLASRKAAGKTQAEAPKVDPETMQSELAAKQEAREAGDMADAIHAAREAEVAEQESEPPFGSDDPIPPPLADEQKIAAIAAMFRPGDPAALTAALRAKVKTACTILEIWGKNTPTELFLLFGDDALSAPTLEAALAKALDDRQARIDAQKAQEAAQAPHEAPSSISQALKTQDEKVAKVEAVLSGLDDVQRTKVERGLELLGISSDAAARELWLSFGPASLDAGTLVEALEKPPWETPDGGEA